MCFQALEETKLNQIRIMSELEKEKIKMQEDVLKLKEAKVLLNYIVRALDKSVTCENHKILTHSHHG